MKLAEPTTGLLPSLTYDFDAGPGVHRVKCQCGASIATTEPLTARRFTQTEMGKHAKHRIVNPETPDDL